MPASRAREGGIEELSLEGFRRLMSVNVDSVFLGAKHGIKYLAKNQPGSIVNISSIAGLIANHTSPGYNASKAAVWLLSKNIALYCAKKGLNVRSNSIHPTFIDTPILDPIRGMFGKDEAEAKLGRQVPLGRIGKPEEIGAAARLSPFGRKPLRHRRGNESRRRHLSDVTCRRHAPPKIEVMNVLMRNSRRCTLPPHPRRLRPAAAHARRARWRRQARVRCRLAQNCRIGSLVARQRDCRDWLRR